MIIKENVVKLFLTDTLICSLCCGEFKKFMQKKHKFSDEQYKEFLHVYMAEIDNICLCNKKKKKQ